MNDLHEHGFKKRANSPKRQKIKIKKSLVFSWLYAIVVIDRKKHVTTRIKLHFTCLLRRPENWRFYVSGIIREIFGF